MMCDYELEELGRAISRRCGEVSRMFDLGGVRSRAEWVDAAVELAGLVAEIQGLAQEFCDGADAPDAMAETETEQE